MGRTSDGGGKKSAGEADGGGKKATGDGRDSIGADIRRTISLDFQLSDIQDLQKTLRSMSEDQNPRCCPSLFDRAASSWWNPKFDSDILEGQYWRSTFPRTTRRFQFGLAYLLLLCLTWAIYFPIVATPHWYMFLAASLSAGTLVFLMFLVTVTPLYTKHCFKVSLLLCLLLCSLSLLVYLNLPLADSYQPAAPQAENTTIEGEEDEGSRIYVYGSTLGTTDISEAGLFALYVEVLLLVYTVIPLPLYATLLVGSSYTILFEIIAATRLPPRQHLTMFVQVLLHLCVHIVGCHILIMTQVRMRDTFMKVGQSLLVKRQLGMEKQLKEKMIHSVMPPKVADWLMKGGHGDNEDDVDIDSETGSMMRKISSPRSSNQGDIRTIFRPFNMNAMDDVSILFADIVGFTKMSSNKTASQLVGLLNDLFGRFDRMCMRCQCEKISTLGDCYYCVSGCPEPTPDHAANCVEMGLSMIKAIKDFDEDCNESVNMRVGIHTGTVLCGIVGKKRFKFDVWSNDVSFANRMESTGQPGRVHISEKTYQFLTEDYYVQQAEDYNGIKTYFITGRKSTSVYQLRAEKERKTPPAQATNNNNNNNNNNNKVKMKDLQPNGTKSLPILGSQDPEPGKVYNKLCRFMRQRSAPSEALAGQALGTPGPPPSLPSNGSDAEQGLMRKSEGSTPARDLAASSGDNVNPNTEAGERSDLDCLRAPAHTCPLASMDSEFDITPGLRTPAVEYGQSFENLRQLQLAEEAAPHNNVFEINEVEFAHEFLAPMVDINNVYCHTSNNSVNTSSDIALTFQEVNSVNFSGLTSRGLPHSLAKFHQLRKQSDLVLIKSVQEDASHHHYFTKPPLHPLSLFFLDPAIEKEYRRTAWKANHNNADLEETTLASSSFNAYFDILVSGIVFLVVCFACFLHYQPGEIWLGICFVAASYHLLVVFVCVKQMVSPSQSRSAFRMVYSWCRKWYPSQVFGALLVSLPVISVISNLTCENFDVFRDNPRNYYLNLLTVCIVHFCNFNQLYCYIKSVLASLFACSILVFLAVPSCSCPYETSDTAGSSGEVIPDLQCGVAYSNFIGELLLNITLLLVLLWVLNREFEINYRLSFHCSLLAARDRKKILNLKNQADWLLHNIIPKHVSDQLKKSAKYSENHKDVGVVFASLVNFNELYDESYMGGKEYLRVLNELISDFDELLDKPEFRNIEKIKTIGATFMAASGLNPFIRGENQFKYQHIQELMEFAFSLQRVVEDFNQSLIEFDLILRIGLNFGDVTSGVIGTTKLYYDIWGDAVNIASRMDSTGVDSRIQVNERTKDILKQWYEFEERGKIFVKGKDLMNVYLFVKCKESAYRMF